LLAAAEDPAKLGLISAVIAEIDPHFVDEEA
jgi:hypothetical protein